ncbi:MAG: peptide chain release factor-like protein [Omnitrophica bacterium]|nr:peptide chain release factor-like protein [Candidatus Omnitrophota bacterium]
MKKLNIKETDIIERFIRSRGPGGQNVNKTSTCVYLKHLPSGVEIKCQKYRSQALNRFFARRILVKKIETILLGEKSQEQKRIYKLKKQKRKRSKRAKEKILRQKHILSEKKQARRSIAQSQYE